MRCLLDTCVVSEILKRKNQRIARKAGMYLNQHRQFTFSLLTRYEILRGLKDKNAIKQLADFESFCRRHLILSATTDIIVIGADLWVGLKRAGQLIGDIDLLVAATALRHGLPLATGNVAYFSRIPGLTVDDWTKP